MSIIDGIKEVANVVRKADNIDLYRQILDLQKEAMDLVQENHDLEFKLRELNRNIEIGENLIFRDNSYYLNNKDGNEEGPFCATCWDYEDKLVRMHEYCDDMGHYCNACIMKKKKWRS